MAEGSELSSLPAHLATCTGMLVRITPRNASSNIFPAGPHSSAQSNTVRVSHTHAHAPSLCYLHRAPPQRGDVC